LKQANLFIFGSPREKFSDLEIKALRQFVEFGGSLLILGNEGGDQKYSFTLNSFFVPRCNTNLNDFLIHYGVAFNNDCVLRTSYLKYFNPKEALIQSGTLNEEVIRIANGLPKEVKKPQSTFLQNVIGKDDEEDYVKEQKRSGLDFVYPNGATLKLLEPSKKNNILESSNPILSSGPLCYPSNRPICTIYHSKKGKGKIIVFGSMEIFTDDYFDKENNSKILDFVFKYLLTDEVELDFSFQEPIKKEYDKTPDISEISNKLMSCIQVGLRFDCLFSRKVKSCPMTISSYSTNNCSRLALI